MNRIQKIIFILVVLSGITFGQSKDYFLGDPFYTPQAKQGGLYDYSTTNEINIKVAVWGGVRFPGRYIVPESTTVFDLVSLAGGPVTDAQMDDMRIYRVADDSTRTLIKFDYNDLLWEEGIVREKVHVPPLKPGDALIIPSEPRYFFRDYLSMGLSVFSAVISLALLILAINGN